MGHADLKSIRFTRVFLMLSWIMLCGGIATAQVVVETAHPAAIYINSSEIILEVPPASRSGEMFVPLTETLALALGGEFDYFDKNGRMAVRIWLPGAALEYAEGETIYTSGRIERALRIAPFTLGSWLAVPAASLFSELGFDVEFADEKRFMSRKAPATLIEQIPESLLFPEPKEKEPLEPEKAEPEAAEAPAPRKPAPFQFTYENSFEYKNNKVSGDRAKSSLIPESDTYNKFSLRTEGELSNGYSVAASLRTSSTTNHDFRHGEVNNFNVVAARGWTVVRLYDLNPKVSRFVMRNYQLQGIQYNRESGDITTMAMVGRTPKKLYESLYNRNVIAARAEKRVGDRWKYAAAHVRIDDTGEAQITNSNENSVTSLTAGYNTKPLNFNIEHAMSSNRVFHGEPKKAGATRIEVKRATRKLLFLGNYEQIGNDFVSETTFFTAGRREYSGMVSARLNPRTVVTTGTKNVMFMGESTAVIPIQISAQPFSARKKLKLTMNANNEKSRNTTGSKLTETRQYGATDWFGDTKLSLNFDRRVQRSYQGDLNFRTNLKAQINSQLTDRLSSAIQFRKERKSPNTKPLSRFSRVRLEYELKDWNDIGITYERYYNATDFNRTGVELDYRMLDNATDSEITATYGFYNYSKHNENSVSLKYSYIR